MVERTGLRIVLLLGLVVGALLPLATPAAPVQAFRPEPDHLLFVPGQILVKFKAGTSAADRATAHRLHEGSFVRGIPGIGVEVVSVPQGAEGAGSARYSRDPHVVYAEPNYLAYATGDPNDPYFSRQWGLDNDGQIYSDGLSGAPDADVDAPEAWDVTTGSPDITIAILDSGIDQDHPDLAGKVVDNVNFSASPTVDDNYGHGTHVAGIAAAATNNDEGVAGLGFASSLLNVKVLGDEGWGASSVVAEGIVWAADQGAQVINMSLAYNYQSLTLEAAVDYAWDRGVLLAAAAGNDGTRHRNYPAAYANCMAVAATNDDDERVDEPGWWASNYGDWVDVAAPGLYIYSTFPNHDYAIGKELSYDLGSGTSMATAFVSGLAGLLFGQDPGRTNADVRALIENTADPVAGTGVYWVHGRINAYRAVAGELTTMHVSDIAMWAAKAGRNYAVYTAVTILDGNNAAVSEATVALRTTLPNGSTVDASGVTGADGVTTFKLKSDQTGTYFSAVANVTHVSATYQPDDNLEWSESLDIP